MARTNRGPRLQYNRQRGVYEIRWTQRGDDGVSRSRRLSTRTDDLQAAQAVFAGWLSEYQQDTGAVAPTVERVLEDYLTEVIDDPGRDRAESSRQRAHDAARFIIQGLGDRAAPEIDHISIQRYMDKRIRGVIRGRRRKTASTSTLRRELGVLVAAINHAVRRRRLSADDAPYIELPSESAPRERWLVEEEIDRLLAWAADSAEYGYDTDGRLSICHRYLLLGYATAARRGAILGLSWRQVELDSRLVRYDLDTDGHRRTGGRGNKRRVPVPIADWLVPWLDRIKREAVSSWVMDAPDLNLRRPWERFCAAAARELDNDRYRDLNPHALRHTAATHMARAGVGMWELAGILGDSLETCQRNYLHHAPEHLRVAINHRTPGRASGPTTQIRNAS